MDDSVFGPDLPVGLRPEVQVKVDWLDTVALVRLRGVIDMSTVALIEDDLALALSDMPTALVVDLTETTFMGSKGLHLLATLQGWSTRSGVDMRVVAPTKLIRRPIEITGLDAMLTLDNTLTEALGRIPRQRI